MELAFSGFAEDRHQILLMCDWLAKSKIKKLRPVGLHVVF